MSSFIYFFGGADSICVPLQHRLWLLSLNTSLHAGTIALLHSWIVNVSRLVCFMCQAILHCQVAVSERDNNLSCGITHQ